MSELESLRAKVAKVEALAAEWEGEREYARTHGVFSEGGQFSAAWLLGKAADELRAVLADAPAEQRAEGGAVTFRSDEQLAGRLIADNSHEHDAPCRPCREGDHGACVKVRPYGDTGNCRYVCHCTHSAEGDGRG